MAEETNGAFLLSLIGGVLILLGGFFVLGLTLIGSFGMSFMGYMMGGLGSLDG